MDDLIDSYYDWLKKNTVTSAIGEYISVTTPFLDMHNDCIEIYMKKVNSDTIFITDDGYTINDLESSGVSFSSSKRKEILNNILTSYHLTLDKDKCLSIQTSVKDFPYRKHFFIQGILAINDMFALSKSNVSNIFLEDVEMFLDNEEISYIKDVKIPGHSGFDHNFNFSIGGSKKKKIPTKYIRAINIPDKDNASSSIFAWNDIKPIRGNDSKMIVILNDKKKVNSDIINAYKNYDILPFKWSDKRSIIDALKGTA